MTSNINRGHGHIWQRPDGVKARCGGPGLCVVCQRERAILEAALATQPALKANGERSGASLEAVAAAEINEAYWFRKTNAEAVAAILEHHEHILAGMEAKWRSASELRDELSAPPTNGTTSDRYRAELYDEVWQKARDMGYGNVTNALVELERMKAAPPAAQVHGEQPEVVALRAEVANLKDLLRYFDEHGATQAWVMRYKQALEGAALSAPPAADVLAAIDGIDDFIARCNGDDRGSCESVNVLRRALANYAPPASEQQQAVVMPVARELGLQISPEWTRKMAELEEGHVIGAGVLSLTPAVEDDMTNVRCICCGLEYPHNGYEAGFIAGSGMCQVCDSALPPKDLREEAAEEMHTDCRSEEGITVGLIDTIINCARLIQGREITGATRSAIADLRADRDVIYLIASPECGPENAERLNPHLQPAAGSAEPRGIRMTELLSPCHCGHDGELMGMCHKEGFLSLTCPICNRTVEALSTASLIAEWQKPAPTPPQENDR